MDWETASYIANVLLAFGVIPTLFVAWRAIVSAARNERFEHYVSRYQDIVTHLPYGIFEKGSEELNLKEEHKPWLVAYIDLCAEELFDYLRGAVPASVWSDWQEFIIADFDRGKQLMAIFLDIKDEYQELAHLIEKKEPPRRWSLWRRLWNA